LLGVIYFPLWWYTSGLIRFAKGCIGFLQEANITLAPGLWLKNIMVPMFGQTDWQGRLTSVFMRIVNIIGRTIALIFVIVFLIILMVAWVVFPPFLIVMIAISMFAV